MIRHVVLWQLHDPVDAGRFAAELRRCAGIVPGMLSFEVAEAADELSASCEVGLVANFADREALRAYEEHPLHREVSSRLGPLRRARHVLDFVSA